METFVIGNQTIEADFLGQGYASSAHLGTDGFVYVFTRLYEDSHKLYFPLIDSPHIPKIEVLEKDEYEAVIKMPYYSPVVEDSDEYRLVENLRKGWWRVYFDRELHKKQNAYLIPEAIQDYIDECDAPQSIKDALRALCALVHADNPLYTLDIDEQNVGLDENGNIVLFDVLCSCDP